MGRAGHSEGVTGLLRLHGKRFQVLNYEQAVSCGVIEEIASAYQEEKKYDSYLVERKKDGSVDLLMSDSSHREAREDVSFSRDLSFLLPLLQSLGSQKNRYFDILSYEQVSPSLYGERYAPSSEEQSSRYLIETDSEGNPLETEEGLEILWAEHYAAWSPEDLTLSRDFSFIAPLLNALSA
jgi:hypothetical protein